MAWSVEIDPGAVRDLAKLDPQIARRILGFLHQRIAQSDNPRTIGESLKGDLGEFWKYRVGDYRIVASIEDTVLRVLVVRIGHRREVYR
jgi:mRNA interferase RelE/StbE